jgi:GT2 family glycosyltransferase
VSGRLVRPGEDQEPLCSIVIPTYNRRDLLETCLESILRHLPIERHWTVEIIVVDNGSDDTSDWLAQAHPEVRLVRLEPNQGFCIAANAGLASARGRFIQVLNNDTEVTQGWLESGLAPFADPTIGAVSPLVLVRSDPSRVDSAGDSYNLAGWPTKRGHGQSADHWTGRQVEEVFAASGSSSFFRAEAIRAVGGFDQFFVSYYEDVDLGFRIRWAGYRCVFNPRCRILHEISATYNHGSPKLQRLMARNAELVFWSNMPAGRLAAAIVPHVLLLLAQAGWRMARLRFIPFFLGKLDAVRIARSIQRRRRIRADLARKAIAPAHFPLGVGSVQDVIGHLRRPRERSSKRMSS